MILKFKTFRKGIQLPMMREYSHHIFPISFCDQLNCPLGEGSEDFVEAGTIMKSFQVDAETEVLPFLCRTAEDNTQR